MTKDFVSSKYKNVGKKRSLKNLQFNLNHQNIRFQLIRLKHKLVSRMFWGRSNFYKNFTQFTMLGITIFIAISGLSNRIAVSATTNLTVGQEIVGSHDLLPQGGSIETVLISSTDGIDSIDHVVQSDETLSSIASLYDVSIDTIRWFNPEQISPFSNEIQSGWTLKIPAYQGQPINGVLYTVKKNESIEDVIRVTSITNNEANLFSIVEFNNLPEPYTLIEGQKLFIPDGNLSVSDIEVAGIPKGVFTNPLAHSDCRGYGYSRGYTFYHDGLDLAKFPGCPVQAVASGVVMYAGWENMSGQTVKIDHGGGIYTYYYHAEAVYVKGGERVQQGDIIMKMGSTGNSTGTHLHIVLLKNGFAVDPAPYIPF